MLMCVYLAEPTGGSEDDDLHKAWNLCKRHSKSVEVFYRNMDDEKVLTKIHFPFNPDVSQRQTYVKLSRTIVNVYLTQSCCV